jgi:hypothetical protein
MIRVFGTDRRKETASGGTFQIPQKFFRYFSDNVQVKTSSKRYSGIPMEI